MADLSTFSRITVALGIVSGLAACAAPSSNYPPSYPSQPSASYPANQYPANQYPANQYPSNTGSNSYVEYGRVTNVEVIRVQNPNQTNGAGAVIGGLAGAVIGHQFGGGSGRDLATIAGGVGGAVAGNAIQRNANTQGGYDTYRVSVQTENGNFRSYDLSSANDFRTGDRVRIQNGQLYRN